jgi:hypothetical protein
LALDLFPQKGHRSFDCGEQIDLVVAIQRYPTDTIVLRYIPDGGSPNGQVVAK